jgi:hypothetical protein
MRTCGRVYYSSSCLFLSDFHHLTSIHAPFKNTEFLNNSSLYFVDFIGLHKDYEKNSLKNVLRQIMLCTQMRKKR